MSGRCPDGLRSKVLTCEQCGEHFEHFTNRGPVPKFCGPACRQGAYRSRRHATLRPCPTCGHRTLPANEETP